MTINPGERPVWHAARAIRRLVVAERVRGLRRDHAAALAALRTGLTTTNTRYPGTDLTIAYSIKGHPSPT